MIGARCWLSGLFAAACLAACAPPSPEWARATGPLPEGSARLVMDADGVLCLGRTRLDPSEDPQTRTIPALEEALGGPCLSVGEGLPGECRARIWVAPTRTFGEIRPALYTLETLGYTHWDLEEAPDATRGWAVPTAVGREVGIGAAIGRPPLTVHLRSDEIGAGYTDTLFVRAPLPPGGDPWPTVDELLAATSGLDTSPFLVFTIDDDVPWGTFTRGLDGLVDRFGELPVLGSGGPRTTRPATPAPAPPAEIRVPDQVSLSPDGFLELRAGERSSSIHIQEIVAWRERCEGASCVVLAQPAVGTSWVVGARPRVSGLGARWILGRPVLPLPEALALPAGLPAGEVELRVLPLLDRGVWPPAYDD